jgi:transcriptional regulator with XRE-family HTH domain
MHTRINEIVKVSKLTKTDFAKRLGISQPYLSQICAGQKTPSDRTIQDICREFSVNPEWLRTGEGEPYLKRTREAEIMSFAVETVKGSNEFRRALVSMLATLDDSEWDGLEKLLDKLLIEYKKD